jgi:hypothetical protein
MMPFALRCSPTVIRKANEVKETASRKEEG